MFGTARHKRCKQRSGLTLHQLLCALAIPPQLLILFSLLTVQFIHRGTPSYINVAKGHVEMLEDAINIYDADVGVYPADAEWPKVLTSRPSNRAVAAKWKGPYLFSKKLPLDPWNNAYHYEVVSETAFRIWSDGPDRAPGTDDDISTEL